MHSRPDSRGDSPPEDHRSHRARTLRGARRDPRRGPRSRDILRLVNPQPRAPGLRILVLPVRITHVLEHLVVWQPLVRPGEMPGLSQVDRVFDRNPVLDEIRRHQPDPLMNAHLVAVRHAAEANLLLDSDGVDQEGVALPLADRMTPVPGLSILD